MPVSCQKKNLQTCEYLVRTSKTPCPSPRITTHTFWGSIFDLGSGVNAGVVLSLPAYWRVDLCMRGSIDFSKSTETIVLVTLQWPGSEFRNTQHTRIRLLSDVVKLTLMDWPMPTVALSALHRLTRHRLLLSVKRITFIVGWWGIRVLILLGTIDIYL